MDATGDQAESAAKTPRQSMQYNRLLGELQACRVEMQRLQKQLFAFSQQHARDVQVLQDQLLAVTAGVARKGAKGPPAIDSSEDSAEPPAAAAKMGSQNTKRTRHKNGTPRQGNVCPGSRAQLKLTGCGFSAPDHALEGLAEFSHVWVLFEFHDNGSESIKPKVQPPRLDGRRVGLFSTRSPHRPNAIGLSLVCLESIEGDTITFSGVDIIDGTPILDIKPYIPAYDAPAGPVRVSEWLLAPPIPALAVEFSPEAEAQLLALGPALVLLAGPEAARAVISDVLQGDPRSIYRRNKCKDRPFWVRVDTLDVTAWFVDAEEGAATVAVVTNVALWQGLLKGNTVDFADEFAGVVAAYRARRLARGGADS